MFSIKCPETKFNTFRYVKLRQRQKNQETIAKTDHFWSWSGYNSIPNLGNHYCDVIMGVMVPQIISLTIVYPTVYSGADQRKHQSSASLAIVRGIHQSPVNSPHKGPVTRRMFPFDDITMNSFHAISINAQKPIV